MCGKTVRIVFASFWRVIFTISISLQCICLLSNLTLSKKCILEGSIIKAPLLQKRACDALQFCLCSQLTSFWNRVDQICLHVMFCSGMNLSLWKSCCSWLYHSRSGISKWKPLVLQQLNDANYIWLTIIRVSSRSCKLQVVLKRLTIELLTLSTGKIID